MIEPRGAVCHQERESLVMWSANKIEIFTDSWINPEVAGLPLKMHSATG